MSGLTTRGIRAQSFTGGLRISERKTCAELLGETTLSEEVNALGSHILTVHDERVCGWDYQEGVCALKACSVDADRSVVRSGNHP